jgi:hypothetical protein
MLPGLFLGFLLTTALYGVVLWLACRRVSRHLQGNAEAVKAVADHVLIPLLGRRPEEDSKQTPASNPGCPERIAPGSRPSPGAATPRT